MFLGIFAFLCSVASATLSTNVQIVRMEGGRAQMEQGRLEQINYRAWQFVFGQKTLKLSRTHNRILDQLLNFPGEQLYVNYQESWQLGKPLFLVASLDPKNKLERLEVVVELPRVQVFMGKPTEAQPHPSPTWKNSQKRAVVDIGAIDLPPYQDLRGLKKYIRIENRRDIPIVVLAETGDQVAFTLEGGFPIHFYSVPRSWVQATPTTPALSREDLLDVKDLLRDFVVGETHSGVLSNFLHFYNWENSPATRSEIMTVLAKLYLGAPPIKLRERFGRGRFPIQILLSGKGAPRWKSGVVFLGNIDSAFIIEGEDYKNPITLSEEQATALRQIYLSADPTRASMEFHPMGLIPTKVHHVVAHVWDRKTIALLAQVSLKELEVVEHLNLVSKDWVRIDEDFRPAFAIRIGEQLGDQRYVIVPTLENKENFDVVNKGGEGIAYPVEVLATHEETALFAFQYDLFRFREGQDSVLPVFAYPTHSIRWVSSKEVFAREFAILTPPEDRGMDPLRVHSFYRQDIPPAVFMNQDKLARYLRTHAALRFQQSNCARELLRYEERDILKYAP